MIYVLPQTPISLLACGEKIRSLDKKVQG